MHYLWGLRLTVCSSDQSIMPACLPAELLRLIFASALERSPDDSITPLDYVSLCALSRDWREYVGPLFWSTVTIAKPVDWVALFDPRSGLLTTGSMAEERWAWVKTLQIVEGVNPPVRTEPPLCWHLYGNRNVVGGPISFLEDIAAPPFASTHRLDQLSFIPMVSIAEEDAQRTHLLRYHREAADAVARRAVNPSPETGTFLALKASSFNLVSFPNHRHASFLGRQASLVRS